MFIDGKWLYGKWRLLCCREIEVLLSEDDMKLKKIAAVIVPFCISQTSAMATSDSTGYWSAWGYTGDQNPQGSVGELILDGCLGKSCRKSSFTNSSNDEGAIAVVIAEQINEHGGYFCPYQLQCRNKRKNKFTWTEYFYPNGFSRSKCAWLLRL